MSVTPELDPELLDTDLIDSPSRRAVKVVLGIVVGLVALGIIAVMLALTFSVQVQGHSMEPTLRPDDRLVTDFFSGESNVNRFDLVGVTVPGVGPIVKRVIGMPGDTVTIVDAGGVPTAVVRPAGESADYIVDNPAWPDQIKGDVTLCCTADGKKTAIAATTTVPAGHYWVLGDNWSGSEDSRIFGFVKADQIGATLNFRILPPADFGRVTNNVKLVLRAR